MFTGWKDLNWWKSGEYQVVLENLRDIEHCPSKVDLFAALKACPFDMTKVIVVGQDPYPTVRHATGIAFSIPCSETKWPPTLVNIIRELVEDIGYDDYWPANGDLMPWCNQGVLLLNATPSCQAGKPGSHSHWPEWPFFISEVVQRLSLEGGKVFVLLGSRARELSRLISDRNVIIEAGHPSPMGIQFARDKSFKGSRIFSRVNAALVDFGEEPIDWRL